MIKLGEIYGALRRNADYPLEDLTEVLASVSRGRKLSAQAQAQLVSVGENFDKCGKWVAVDPASARAGDTCFVSVAYAGGHLIVDRRVKQRRVMDRNTVLGTDRYGKKVVLPGYGRRNAHLDRRRPGGLTRAVGLDIPNRRGSNLGRRTGPQKTVYGGHRSLATRRVKDFPVFFQPDPKDRRLVLKRVYTTSPDPRIVALERRKK